MDRKSFDKYELNAEKERELWEDAIIVFDTSALIDFYYYPKETRLEVFDKIFSRLKKRLWVPYHVQFEYLKNRKGIIEKPIIESYEPIKNKKIQEIIEAKTKILKITEQIKKDTLKPEKHPFLPQEKIDIFINFAKEFDDKVQQFAKDLKEEIEKQEADIKSLNENDTILEAFEANIKVGSELTHSEIMQIVSEGKLRYEFEIPPGYKDLKEKEGTQKFGDLIIWKQILSYAKEKNRNVIFICNDLKIDWCHKDSRNRIASPRKELIKEFNDNNQKGFWMYNQSQFIYKAKEFFEVDIADSKIEEISNVINNRNSSDLIYKCNYCHQENVIPFNQLHLEFNCVGGSERNMGEENQYAAEESLECSFCGNEINILFEIWEYPTGFHNYSDISIDSGEIIHTPDFVDYFWENVYGKPDNGMI